MMLYFTGLRLAVGEFKPTVHPVFPSHCAGLGSMCISVVSPFPLFILPAQVGNRRPSKEFPQYFENCKL